MTKPDVTPSYVGIRLVITVILGRQGRPSRSSYLRTVANGSRRATAARWPAATQPGAGAVQGSNSIEGIVVGIKDARGTVVAGEELPAQIDKSARGSERIPDALT